jgi:hypothetical protein
VTAETPADTVQPKVDLRWLLDIAERLTAFTEAWELSSDIETPDGRTIRISGGELRYNVDLAVNDLRAVAREIPDMVENLTDLITKEAQSQCQITTAEQLRALPVGTVLLGSGAPPYPWQIRSLGAPEDGHAESMCCDEWFYLGNDLNVAALLAYGPFRVLHTPRGDR